MRKLGHIPATQGSVVEPWVGSQRIWGPLQSKVKVLGFLFDLALPALKPYVVVLRTYPNCSVLKSHSWWSLEDPMGC